MHRTQNIKQEKQYLYHKYLNDIRFSLPLSPIKYINIRGCLVLTARDVVCKHAVRQ